MAPSISIIVPTYNRSAELPFLFAALARQVYPSQNLELILVDDGSTDQTADLAQRWGRALPFPLRLLRKQRQGPPAARNHGAAHARGEILAFTDSDCLPQPQWLASAARALAQGAGIVCGPLLPVARQGQGLLARQQAPLHEDRGCYPTANLFVRRSVFQAVGGFDEQFGVYRFGEVVAGEDADLAWRMRRRGQRVRFSQGATVWHLATSVSLGRFLLKPLVVQIVPRLLPRIPELRDTYLWHRYFLSSLHLFFYLAVAGVAVAIGTHFWPATLFVLVWAVEVMRITLVPMARLDGAGRGTMRALACLYDHIFQVAVLAFASVRFRRLVL
jgi:glycosyltransferase involved in cell wall biosynthesis